MSKVLLGDVAVEHKETCKGSKDGYPIVGLEHLIPEEITLTAWDEGSENTFSKMFRKGNVLFGRRRAYLKKAAVAPFDGICSGDITVIEAKPDRILPELLPFIIQNDDLFDFAVGKSAGSLSPRVKWEHLKNYEFELPDMEKQKELAELLWAMDNTKKSYQKLIAATDELVKSQFMELFGDPVTNTQGREVRPFKDFMLDIRYGTSQPPTFNELGEFKFIRATNIKAGRITENGMLRISADEAAKIEKCRLNGNEIIIVRSGANTGDTCVVTDEYRDQYAGYDIIVTLNLEIANPVFFNELMNTHYMQAIIKPLTVRAAQPHINSEQVQNLPMLVVPLQEQEQFATFVRQSDKSQFMELFGDPKTNQKGLPILKIGEFGKVKGGKRLPKGESYADHTTNHPYVRVIDMVKHSVTIPALVYLTQATHEKISRYTISSKDVYISIAGTIGQVGAIPDSIDGANLTENAAKIVLNEGAPVDRDYLIWYLSLPAGAEQIEEKTMHTTQPKLALYRIEEIEVLVPPIAEQRSFAAFVQQSDKSKFAALSCSNLNLSSALENQEQTRLDGG